MYVFSLSLQKATLNVNINNVSRLYVHTETKKHHEDEQLLAEREAQRDLDQKKTQLEEDLEKKKNEQKDCEGLVATLMRRKREVEQELKKKEIELKEGKEERLAKLEQQKELENHTDQLKSHLEEVETQEKENNENERKLHEANLIVEEMRHKPPLKVIKDLERRKAEIKKKRQKAEGALRNKESDITSVTERKREAENQKVQTNEETENKLKELTALLVQLKGQQKEFENKTLKLKLDLNEVEREEKENHENETKLQEANKIVEEMRKKHPLKVKKDLEWRKAEIEKNLQMAKETLEKKQGEVTRVTESKREAENKLISGKWKEEEEIEDKLKELTAQLAEFKEDQKELENQRELFKSNLDEVEREEKQNYENERKLQAANLIVEEMRNKPPLKVKKDLERRKADMAKHLQKEEKALAKKEGEITRVTERKRKAEKGDEEIENKLKELTALLAKLTSDHKDLEKQREQCKSNFGEVERQEKENYENEMKLQAANLIVEKMRNKPPLEVKKELERRKAEIEKDLQETRRVLERNGGEVTIVTEIIMKKEKEKEQIKGELNEIEKEMHERNMKLQSLSRALTERQTELNIHEASEREKQEVRQETELQAERSGKYCRIM